MEIWRITKFVSLEMEAEPQKCYNFMLVTSFYVHLDNAIEMTCRCPRYRPNDHQFREPHSAPEVHALVLVPVLVCSNQTVRLAAL